MYEDVIAQLDDAGKSFALFLRDKLNAMGYSAFVSPAGKKPNNYKCEFKKKKSYPALVILRVDGEKLTLCLKLQRLSEYSDKLSNLSGEALSSFLSSGGCNHDSGGCKGPIRFVYNEKPYEFCRHGMEIKSFTQDDLPAIIGLLETECV